MAYLHLNGYFLAHQNYTLADFYAITAGGISNLQNYPGLYPESRPLLREGVTPFRIHPILHRTFVRHENQRSNCFYSAK